MGERKIATPAPKYQIRKQIGLKPHDDKPIFRQEVDARAYACVSPRKTGGCL